MNLLTSCFERRWFTIFMAMYLFIMLPLPFFYNTHYVAGWLGVPIFIYGWIAHGITVLALIILYAFQCLKRPEYQDEALEETP
ncbi:hypothetical protein [Dryocola clanedunensis]|uniref:hypothetical protein n=1 Tax=Cedecea sulfonylureivorans TaxID=3051154 RepID=UPI001926AE6D|nr:hypothetical protein [Cedecea sulfonylureivorans]